MNDRGKPRKVRTPRVGVLGNTQREQSLVRAIEKETAVRQGWKGAVKSSPNTEQSVCLVTPTRSKSKQKGSEFTRRIPFGWDAKDIW